jgi:hypothetical protein
VFERGLYGAAPQPGITGAPVDAIEFYNEAQDHYFIHWIPNEIAIHDGYVQLRDGKGRVRCLSRIDRDRVDTSIRILNQRTADQHLMLAALDLRTIG